MRSSTVNSRDEVKIRVCEEIDAHADRIVALGEDILRKPETGFREFETARRVAAEFDYLGMPYRDGLALTGLKGRMRGRSSNRTVALLGELDSLIVSDHPFADPATGAAHACGHNAMIASMLGAGLGLRPVMDFLDGDVVLFAVPAEECIELEWRLSKREAGELEFLLGKAELLRLGEFDDIDLALLSHTGGDATTEIAVSLIGTIVKRVQFRGRAAHAGATPWEGINAFKALTLALAAVDAQRDTFRDADSVRIHQLVGQGGEAVNVVPAEATMDVMIRAATLEAISGASMKVDRSLRAGALALGAEVTVKTFGASLPLSSDAPLVDLVYGNATRVCKAHHVLRDGDPLSAGTDAGDLAHVMPLVHSFAASGTAAPLHSNEYYAADHVRAMIEPAKFMAMTVVDLLWDGAAEAERVIAECGAKLTPEEYVALRRQFEAVEVFTS